MGPVGDNRIGTLSTSVSCLRNQDVTMEFLPPWGKFDARTGRKHHLAHHCADVAACFLALARLPVIRTRLEAAAGRQLDDTDLDRLGVLAFLHDIGKLHPGFQAKGWPEGHWRDLLRGHVQEGYDIFHAMLQGRLPDRLNLVVLEDWGLEDYSLLLTVLAHHGRPLNPSVGDRVAHLPRWHQGYDPLEEATVIGRLLPAWFPRAFVIASRPLPAAPAFQHLFAGLVALADWIGSDAHRFDFAEALDRSYMARAADTAAAALTAFNLDPARQRAARAGPASFSEVSGFATPNAQQALIGEIGRAHV
jgi:CRISPR-associated endonuclease/helicase Cas3